MTWHLIIQRENGLIRGSILRDLAARTSPLLPGPIAKIPLTDHELELGLEALTAQWMRTNGYAPVTPPAPALPVPARQGNPREQRTQERDEIHLGTASVGPLQLPDGRQVEIGDGLVILSTYRFAQLVEAARFGRQPTDI
jgi:hypothetical protein